MPDSLSTYLEFVSETAYLAGRLTLGYFGAGIQPDLKADLSPVTIADRQAEELIRSRIERYFPEHAIVGEEFGVTGSEDASHRWYIDPIDGTKSFVRGVPLYGVLIGLEVDGRVEAGAAYFPALDELVAAASGLGCWWNGRRAHASPAKSLSEGIVTCTDPGMFARLGRGEALQRLYDRAYFRTGWSDAYGYALVATGRAEVALDPIMSDWDCGPFPPILREAGGYFGDWRGNVTIHAREGMATTQALLPEVLEALNGD